MGEEERLHWGSSFRQVLTILSAGRQAEGLRELMGYSDPLEWLWGGEQVQAVDGKACTRNSTLATQDQWGFASLINISKWPRMASSISNPAAEAMFWLQPWHWAWRPLLGCWSCPSTLVLKQKARTAGPTSMEGRKHPYCVLFAGTLV